MTWGICFDFPELDGPLFAGFLADGSIGFAPTLATAERFASEDAAIRTLENGFAPETRGYGAIVEFAEARL